MTYIACNDRSGHHQAQVGASIAHQEKDSNVFEKKEKEKTDMAEAQTKSIIVRSEQDFSK